MGRPFVTSREPGGTELAEDLRSLLLTPRPEIIPSETEMLLLLAGRVQHTKNLIEPALQRGELCIVDRGPVSTFAYQCWPDPTKIEFFDAANRLLGIPHPDITLIIDIPVEVSEQRRAARSGESDRFEMQNREYFNRTRSGMLAFVERYGGANRIVLVDGCQSIDRVQKDMMDQIIELI